MLPLWDSPPIKKFQFPHPQHSFDNICLHQNRILHVHIHTHIYPRVPESLVLFLCHNVVTLLFINNDNKIKLSFRALYLWRISVWRSTYIIYIFFEKSDNGFNQCEWDNVFQVYTELFDLNHFLTVQRRTFLSLKKGEPQSSLPAFFIKQPYHSCWFSNHQVQTGWIVHIIYTFPFQTFPYVLILFKNIHKN